MGKWTPDYTDDVLHAKISNLVSGSIRRAAVEKEPSISYENFVTDLDTGDSFTASLIDILVKELADRRTRTNDNDRKLVGERTIRSLRTLANNSRTFSQRIGYTHPRRSSARPEYFAATANPMDLDDDEEEYDVMMENPSAVEGIRVNSDLYDAYAPSHWAAPSMRRNTASPPTTEEWAAPEAAARPWTFSTMNTGLTRQASIRRPRSRVIDFHEHAHRRRSNVRDSLTSSRSDAPESVTEPREGLSTGIVRRFFPLSRARRFAPVYPTWPEGPDTLSPDSDDAGSAYYSGWVGATPDATQPPPEPENQEETEFLLRAPRLRLRTTPEQLVATQASSEDEIPGFSRSYYAEGPVAEDAAPQGPENTNTEDTSTSSPRPEGTTALTTDEPVAYPTPGSTENENTA